MSLQQEKTALQREKVVLQYVFEIFIQPRTGFACSRLESTAPVRYRYPDQEQRRASAGLPNQSFILHQFLRPKKLRQLSRTFSKLPPTAFLLKSKLSIPAGGDIFKIAISEHITKIR